ncbi:MAG: argininosuccinate synthase [Eggerthellaceae bacterium]|nr:argininosuccinate synthase [Eggerthellaceae bacterium]
MSEKEIAVLAYSGGLDTSVCIKWLIDELNLDVVAVVGDVGQEHSGLEKVKARALASGAIDCIVVDMREEYADEYLTCALAANALYENKYPLLSALSRPVISKHLVNVAHQFGAKYIAHGCTGKGNDQVRFESCVLALDPSLKIIAPVREWDLHTRNEEMEWAKEHGLEVPTTTAKPYSIDDNIWGRAIECGVLENPWNEPPDDIWEMTVSPQEAPDEPTYVEVEFKGGVPCAIDGKSMSYLDVIYKMNEVAGSNGFGRLDLIEDRVVGVKSRECYEAPGALALIKAHQALEDMVLERDLLLFKLGAEQKWAEIVYSAMYFSPLKVALDAFFDETQKCVTGVVRMRFYKGNCDVVGVKSDYSLYDYGLATYDADDSFNHDAAKGFIELATLRNRVWSINRHKMDAIPEQMADADSSVDEFSK